MCSSYSNSPDMSDVRCGAALSYDNVGGDTLDHGGAGETHVGDDGDVQMVGPSKPWQSEVLSRRYSSPSTSTCSRAVLTRHHSLPLKISLARMGHTSHTNQVSTS